MAIVAHFSAVSTESVLRSPPNVLAAVSSSLLLSQVAVRIEAQDIPAQYIHTAARSRSGIVDRRPSFQSLHGPDTATLELCAQTRIIMLLRYTVLFTPGAHPVLLMFISGIVLLAGMVRAAACKVQATVVCFAHHPRLELAGGTVLEWGGRETTLPLGFDVLRLQSNGLQCYASEDVPFGAPADAGHHFGDAVQLLCRALRMAPACYRRIELGAAHQEQRLEIVGGRHMYVGAKRVYCGSPEKEANFDGIAELAAAMQHYAHTEVPKLSVLVSPDERTIVVHRINSHVSGTGLLGGIRNI